jgi:hypothetical protein
VVEYFGYRFVTASSGTYTFTNNAAGCASPASSSIVVNAQPATPAAPTAGTVTQPTCATQQAVSRLQVIAHPILLFTSVVKFWYRISNASSGTYTFTQTNAAGSSPASSSIVNAQPATPAAQQQEQLRSQHVQLQQAVSDY